MQVDSLPAELPGKPKPITSLPLSPQISVLLRQNTLPIWAFPASANHLIGVTIYSRLLEYRFWKQGQGRHWIIPLLLCIPSDSLIGSLHFAKLATMMPSIPPACLTRWCWRLFYQELRSVFSLFEHGQASVTDSTNRMWRKWCGMRGWPWSWVWASGPEAPPPHYEGTPAVSGDPHQEERNRSRWPSAQLSSQKTATCQAYE